MKTLTKEERDLLLKEICSRLPYGLMANIPLVENDKRVYKVTISWLQDFISNNLVIIPILRPMEAMTDEELEYVDRHFTYTAYDDWEYVDWLNSRHLDYRGLIPLGLAIAATEENNPYKNQ